VAERRAPLPVTVSSPTPTPAAARGDFGTHSAPFPPRARKRGARGTKRSRATTHRPPPNLVSLT
jgi:hypothetical protein